MMNGECRSCGYRTDNPAHICPGLTNVSEWPPLADALQSYMSEISEEAWCAGWINGLEYDLWRAVCDDRTFGRYGLERHQIATLRALSEQINGWMMRWDRYVPMDQWVKVYAGEWV